jgi:hypothetical protein
MESLSFPAKMLPLPEFKAIVSLLILFINPVNSFIKDEILHIKFSLFNSEVVHFSFCMN